MNKKLKTWELSFLFALCFALCLGTWAQARQDGISSSLVRLHVIAASDDAYEQALKLRVRDSVLELLSPRLENTADCETARQIIEASESDIKRAAQSVSEGRDIAVTLSEEYYPTREYDGFSLPAGRYYSLRVIIGEGQGHNWWCVVFPPLCLSAAERDEALEALSDDAGGIISENDGYRIKFRIVELWNELTELLERKSA